MLLCGYAVQRAACQVGLPYDGLQQARTEGRLQFKRAILLTRLPVASGGDQTNRAVPLCQAVPSLPYHSTPQISFFEFFSDVSSIALHGAVLGWFVGITSPRRFRWLFSWRRWYAAATFLGTPPVYSAIRYLRTALGVGWLLSMRNVSRVHDGRCA